MLQGKSKFKQIEGLEAIHQLFTNQIGALETAVGSIDIGQPSLTGKIVTIPFTDSAGTVVNKTLDLSSLVGPDVQIQSAVIAANSFDIVITETDGTQEIVPLKALFDQYLLEYIKPLIDAKASQASVDTLAGRVSTVEGEVASKASQVTVDSLTSRVTAVETAVATAQTTADEADTKAEAAQTAAQAAQSDADAAQSSADTANAAITLHSGRIQALEDAKITGVVPVVMTGKPTANDGDLASDDVVPANVKHITSLQINGEFVLWGAKTKAAYFSNDGGLTAITANLGGSKLYWNKTVIDYNIAADDQVVIVAIV